MGQPKTLAVILGAGASFDCVDNMKDVCQYNNNWRPPLTHDIFSSRFVTISSRYPALKSIAEDFRARLVRKTEAEDLNLESYIRQIRDNQNALAEYVQIPLYLQELFGEISEHFISPGGVSKYVRLCRMLRDSDYDKILILTTNYDLLIDRALEEVFNVYLNTFDLNGQDPYMSIGNKCLLVKLHGSANWGRRIKEVTSESTGTVNVLCKLNFKFTTEKSVRVLNGHQDSSRFIEGNFYYPSLAIPVRDKVGFACPETHIEFAKQLLEDCEQFLIIGYSGVDEDIYEMLEVAKSVKWIRFVSRDQKSAENVSKRFSKRLPQLNSAEKKYSSGGFSEFVMTDEAAADLSANSFQTFKEDAL